MKAISFTGISDAGQKIIISWIILHLSQIGSSTIEGRIFLTGLLEHTNEPYAIAKIAGIKLCEAYRDQYGCNFISVMPTNLYGPNDNYDLKNSHVLPALIRKFHEAKIKADHSVTLWGTGEPRREFLHADDLADACFYLMQHYNEPEFVNMGTGKDLTINDLAHLISNIVGFKGKIVHDPVNLMEHLANFLMLANLLHWDGKPSIGLEEGIRKVYQQFLESSQVAA